MEEKTLKFTRRQFVKGVGALGAAAVLPGVSAPAIAKDNPLKIGILSPRGGVMASVGQQGRRATQWAVDRINAEGGIAGRKVEVVFEEEGSPQQTIERFRKLVLTDKVDCVQGLISTGTTNALAPVAEQERKMLMTWDGTTQDGVVEKMPNPRYVFKSTNNECDALMAGLLTVVNFKGKFKTIAGINPDYSYGRNGWDAFQAVLKRYEIDAKPVAEQWVPIGATDLTAQVNALKAAKPDLIFSSMLFASLPIFMRQAYAAGLLENTQLVLPAAGWQINELEKVLVPEGTLFGHDTMYFAYPEASDLQKAFVDEYMDRYNEVPQWETDRAYFTIATYKAGVEAAHQAAGRWPSQNDIIDAIPGHKVESLGGIGWYRSDKVAVQPFYQGLSTNDNDYKVSTLAKTVRFHGEQIQMPHGADFWEWIKTAEMPI